MVSSNSIRAGTCGKRAHSSLKRTAQSAIDRPSESADARGIDRHNETQRTRARGKTRNGTVGKPALRDARLLACEKCKCYIYSYTLFDDDTMADPPP